MALRVLAVIGLLTVVATTASAQHGYEFEVYDTEIGSRGLTEFELSSNYVASGLPQSEEGLYATHHALRSNAELSRTIGRWLQGSAYISANTRPGRGPSYVGNRVKLTAIAPSNWNLPLDVGVANELVFSKAGFGEYRWAYEITPIIAKTFGAVAFVLNPALERGLSGAGVHHIEMEPRARIGYGFGDDASVGLEYYAGLGGIGEGYALAEQRHQLFAKIEGDVSPRMEGSLGLGKGLTRSSDKWVLTAALEYRTRK